MLKLLTDSFKAALEGRRRLSGVRVFSYHGVVEKKQDLRLERNFHLRKDFEAHVRFLKKCGVISVQELAVSLERGKKTSASVITFDDGYANNLMAAEILQAYKLPWTVFLTAGLLESGSTIWTAELSLLLMAGNSDQAGCCGRRFSLSTRESREAAFQEIRNSMKTLSAEAKNQEMENLRSFFPKAELARLLEEHPCFKMLSWKDVRRLEQAGAEIGSHGFEHEIHHLAQPEAVRQRELELSKKMIESKLGRPCRFLAYPNGKYVRESEHEARAAGYKMAFTTRQDTARLEENLFRIPRLDAAASPESFIRNYYWEAKA